MLTEQGEWFHGCGTIDMKDGDAALVETLIRFKNLKRTMQMLGVQPLIAAIRA